MAPAFDLNPAREMREHATAVNGTRAAPTATDVLDVRSFFGLTELLARKTIREVAAAIAQWRSAASDEGVSRAEQDQVEVALSALDTAARI